MYRVLIAVDTNEQRAKRAAEAILSLPGKSDDIEATVLHVLPEFDVADEGGRVSSDEINESRTLPESVTMIESMFEDAGVPTEIRRETGKPAKRIVEIADEIEADLIVVGGRKRTPTGKVIFGSVTQSVILSADRSVLVTSKPK